MQCVSQSPHWGAAKVRVHVCIAASSYAYVAECMHGTAAHLLIDCCVPAVVISCSSKYNSVKIWDNVELLIEEVVVLYPGRPDPYDLTPA